jgi:hypothetical protein
MNHKCSQSKWGCTGVLPEIGIRYNDETYIKKCTLCMRWVVDINFAIYEVTSLVQNAEEAFAVASTKHEAFKARINKEVAQ